MNIIDKLLKSSEPSIRYKARVNVLGESKNSGSIKKLQQEIKKSARVRKLLKNRDSNAYIKPVRHAYKKWNGAHWILATLSDIGHPYDKNLSPIIDQVMDTWLQPVYMESVILKKPVPCWKDKGVPIINGRARRCGSQHANILYSALSLGFIDERADQLAELLMKWQWPDGGWNCDRVPAASHSSFWESIIPLRALSLYAKITRSKKAKAAAKRAAELFLKKKLYKKESSGQIMNPQFIKMHYPLYWHYDILHGLKILAEAGFIRDKRCGDALDLLESKRLPDGGWPAEAKFYQSRNPKLSGYDLVDWGKVDRKTSNEWITVDALYVLNAAGRL